MKKRGTGMSCNTHPAGLKGGGDPSQAQIRLKPDGTLDLLVGAVDIGQGSKTILRQIAADEMGVPIEAITINNFDTDTGPDVHRHLCQQGDVHGRQCGHQGNGRSEEKDPLLGAKALGAGADDILVADNMVSVRGERTCRGPWRRWGPWPTGGENTWWGQALTSPGRDRVSTRKRVK